jgi:hypothetical protein
MQKQSTETIAALGLDAASIQPIQRNKYCMIASAHRQDGQRCIIKDYGKSDPLLAQREALALERYDAICRDIPDLNTCRLLAYSPAHNALAMSFVKGPSLTRLVYRGLLKAHDRRQAIAHARTLGKLLRELYQRHRDERVKLGGFMQEYMLHASDRLAAIPLFGRMVCGCSLPSAGSLFDDARDCGEPVSFCHGDFVPRNMHADADAIGLIDWANTAADSHILNDVYNLYIALRNMLLPPRYRRRLIEALSAGLGDLRFDIRLHRFFYEYHRRRWLMLKLYARRPWPWLQALRGMFTFARPFAPQRLGPLQQHIKGAA